MSGGLTTKRETCRICGRGNLAPIFSLGNLCVSDFLGDGEEDKACKAPLELVLCNVKDGGCGLLQLKHTVSHETMYRNYWYRSGVNKTMTDELIGIAQKMQTLAKLKAKDRVIDIGANDGTLLRAYTAPGLNLIGYEPAKNLRQYNAAGATRIFEDFFDAKSWRDAFGGAKAKVITAIAMFYDLEDPNAFVRDIKECLAEDGIFVVQQSYLPLMLTTNEIGNICHEHLEYYSLLSMDNLLRRHDMEIFDVELNDINGGSFRTYIRHRGGKVRAPIGADIRAAGIREYEKGLGLSDRKVYEDFAKRVEAIRAQTVGFVKQEVARGKKVHVYGASTKGNTLLQHFGLTHELIEAAAERNPDKWGKKTVGTGILIISEEAARAARPDYFLVLPWHFLAEFIEREQEFLARGGKFIVPMPEFRIVEF
jgi:SAM-dependent methyltransferase